MPTINTLLTDALAPALVSTAIDAAVRVAVVLGIAAIATRLLWRSSAALRHSLWTAAIAGALDRHRGRIDVAGAILLVLELPLVLEDAQHRPHRGVARRIRHFGEDLGSGGATEAVDHAHDLPLAAAELRKCGHVTRAGVMLKT